MRIFKPHLFFAVLFLGAACTQAQPAPQSRAEDPARRAERILTEVPLADGHNDWPYALRKAYGVEGAKTADLSADPSGRVPPGHTSLSLLREGKLGIQLWSNYVPASLAPDEAVSQTFEQLAISRSIIDRHPEAFTFVTTADEAEAAWKSGRIASFLSLEGAHQVDDDIEILRRAHAAGVRALTLSHSLPTKLFDSATAPARHGGIAPAAPAFIAEMNRLGVMVDLSHVSPAAMHAVLDITRSPVIFTHSNAKGLTNHPRNVPDDVLKRLKANGGVIMITFVPGFSDQARADWQAALEKEMAAAGTGPDGKARIDAWLKANPRPITTLAMVADHVDYAAKLAGHDHVGIGGDFDGIPDTPVGLETVGTYPALFAELARRGWSDENLRKLAGENFLRALRANEAQAGR